MDCSFRYPSGLRVGTWSGSLGLAIGMRAGADLHSLVLDAQPASSRPDDSLRTDAVVGLACSERLFCHVYGRGRETDQPDSGLAVSAGGGVGERSAQLRAVVGRLQRAGHWSAGNPPVLVVCGVGYDVTCLAGRTGPAG